MMLIVGLHVDDLLMGHSHPEIRATFLAECPYKVKDLGAARRIVGGDVQQDVCAGTVLDHRIEEKEEQDEVLSLTPIKELEMRKEASKLTDGSSPEVNQEPPAEDMSHGLQPQKAKTLILSRELGPADL